MTTTPNFTAALLALFALAVLSFIDNFVAGIAEEAGVWQFQFVRTMMAVPLLIFLALLTRRRWRPVSFRRTALRSLAVAVGLLIYFASLGALPVAQAGAGLFSAPIWVVLLSALFFSVRITPLTIVPMVTGFVGVLLLLQPDPDAFSVQSLMPLAAGAFYGLGMLLTSYFCRNESPIALAIGILAALGAISLVVLVYFTLVPVGAPGFVTDGWRPPTERFLWLTGLQALGAVVAITCPSQAYRIGTPSYVAVFEYAFLIFASLWAFLLWGTTTGPVALAGIAIILVSGTVLSLTRSGGATG